MAEEVIEEKVPFNPEDCSDVFCASPSVLSPLNTSRFEATKSG